MFTIDFTSRVPIYEQICNNVIRLASAGVFKSGDRLPPVRTVAKEIGVNPNTVAKAYRTLEIDGYIYSTVGRGTFMTDKLTKDTAYRDMALKAFREATKNAELYPVLESILNRPDEQTIVTDETGNEFACFSKNFGTDIGIMVCGNFINDKEFRMEYYYPYLHGSQITTCETIEIERHAAREAFAGI